MEDHKITGPCNTTVAYGNSKKPDGRGDGLNINKKRKFAETPEEYRALLLEVLENELCQRGFDAKKKKLVLAIAGKLITEKNWKSWINDTAPQIYTRVENFILSNL